MTPDPNARLRLRVAVKLLLAAAVGAFAVVAFGFFFGGPDRGPGTVERIALGDLAPGQTRTVGYDGRAVIILHRSPETIEALAARDAAGEIPAWLAAYSRGTGQGCPVVWEPGAGEFRETCGDLRYDAAGRPLTEGHTPLEQPPHRIEDGVLILGRD